MRQIIHKKSLLPWLIALGFALLFLSQFVPYHWPFPTYIDDTPLVSISSPLPSVPSNVVGQVVSKVIDGDTVELSGGTRVRLIGIDAPEKGDCFSEESTDALRVLVEGKNVAVEHDIQEKDKYGRTLAYIYINSTFVNEKMIKDGFAKILTIPPDIKYTNEFITAQKEARSGKRGLWADNVYGAKE